MPTLVCIRHGQSQWNLENRFTGWVDQGLSPTGEVEAANAGALLRNEGFQFDAAFTSVLTRAIHTLDIVLHGMGQSWINVTKAWQLNERHYGALQGLNKAETAEAHGAEQVHIWRRSYDTPPPPVTRDDPNWPGNDRRYAAIPADQLPLTECLKDTVDRVVPYWDEHIKPLVVVPKSAVRTDKLGSHVYVQLEPGSYRRRAVDVTRVALGLAGIGHGLKVGEFVVIKGAFLVASVAKKDTLGHGHAH